MGKSAKFFKRPTRKEKAVLSLTKGEPSLFDAVHSSKDTNNSNNDEESAAASGNSRRKSKKDGLSATANPTIAKKSSSNTIGGPAGAAHPSKSSLAYKMQLHGGVKQAVKDLSELDNEVESEDEDMMEEDAPKKKTAGKKQDLDKSKPRPDYVELMYGKQGGGNKRKTFMPKPKPALIK